MSDEVPEDTIVMTRRDYSTALHAVVGWAELKFIGLMSHQRVHECVDKLVDEAFRK